MNKSETKAMTWSFSRLNLYDECPYAWYLKYIEKESGEQNFYAENGKIMHEIFEMIANHEISIEETPEYYLNAFEEIEDDNVKQSTKDGICEKCLDYLTSFNGLDEEKYDIIGVEMKLNFKIKNYKFVGFVDLLLRDKKTGKIILIDHKSSDHFMKKDGVTPLKSSIQSFLSYKKQMYLYAYGLKEQHSIDIETIVWHHFKDNGELTIIPFNDDELQESIDWALDVIKRIEKDDDFESNRTFMRCHRLCDFRNDCVYLEEE